jgi:hypothetical protein
MAQAADQHTAKECSLDDYVADLIAKSGCNRPDALSEMRERFVHGRLILIRQRLVDGNPYNPWDRKPYNKEQVEPDDFERSYSLSLQSDFRGGYKVRVHVISSDSFEYCYTVAELPWLTASQTGPAQQLEDKTGPAKAADRSSAEQSSSSQESLTSKEWIKLEIERREKLGDIPEEITEFSRQLHSQMKDALRAGVVDRAIVPRTIETHLRVTWKIFPKKKRSKKS